MCVFKNVVIFNLFDWNFDQVITLRDIENMMPLLMQDARKFSWNLEDLEDYNQWFRHIAELALLEFDITNHYNQLNWRSFRKLARHDTTIQDMLKLLEPNKDEYGVLKYAKGVARQEDAKQRKKEELKAKKKAKQKKSSQKQASQSASASIKSNNDNNTNASDATTQGATGKEMVR